MTDFGIYLDSGTEVVVLQVPNNVNVVSLPEIEEALGIRGVSLIVNCRFLPTYLPVYTERSPPDIVGMVGGLAVLLTIVALVLIIVLR